MNLDYRVYHAINVFVVPHSWIGRALSQIENYAVPLIAIATFALCFLDRPDAQRKWKLASASALAAAAAALVANQLIAQVWHRTRPFAAHPSAHVWGARSHDPSFPSDHASAAFAIAFAVLLFDRLAGAMFLAAAIVVGFGRIVIGAHYPADVLAGVLVGLAAALLLAKLGWKFIELPVGWVERLTDPVVARLWNRPNRAPGTP